MRAALRSAAPAGSAGPDLEMKARPKAHSSARFAGGALALVVAILIGGLLMGCGGGDDSSTTTVSTPAGDTSAAGSGESGTGSKAPSAAEVKAQLADYQACLEEHGASPDSLPTPDAKGNPFDSGSKQLQEGLAKLREAAGACREKLPKDAPSVDGSSPDLGKLRDSADQQLQGIQAFRDCMGQHGYGPEANGTKPSGDLRQAFSDCRAAGQ